MRRNRCQRCAVVLPETDFTPVDADGGVLCPDCVDHHSSADGDLTPEILDYANDPVPEDRRANDAVAAFYGSGANLDETGTVSDDSMLFEGGITPPQPFAADLPNCGRPNKSGAGVTASNANFSMSDQSSAAALQVSFGFVCFFQFPLIIKSILFSVRFIRPLPKSSTFAAIQRQFG